MAATDRLNDKLLKATLKQAKMLAKPIRISDGGGLYFLARPSGVGWWRWRFWEDGKEGMLSFGVYPDVPLKLARERRSAARQSHAAGFHPSLQRKAEKNARVVDAENAKFQGAGIPGPGTFEHTALTWHAYSKVAWSTGHALKVLSLLQNDLLPVLGRRSLREILAPEVLSVARGIEARGAVETAYRAIRAASAIFRYGVQSGICDADPTRDLKGAIVLRHAEHRAAITDPAKLGELLRAIDGYQGTPVVRAALALAPLVFLRPGELRRAEWSEIDLSAGIWSIPAARMKGRLNAKRSGVVHIVPLAPQAIAIFEGLKPFTSHSRFVFPNPLDDDRPLSDNGVLSALRRMGFPKTEVSGHGFRATARTIAVERLGISAEVVEAQLAHAVGDALGRAYNRTQFVVQRRDLMNRWAEYLDELRHTPQR